MELIKYAHALYRDNGPLTMTETGKKNGSGLETTYYWHKVIDFFTSLKYIYKSLKQEKNNASTKVLTTCFVYGQLSSMKSTAVCQDLMSRVCGLQLPASPHIRNTVQTEANIQQSCSYKLDDFILSATLSARYWFLSPVASRKMFRFTMTTMPWRNSSLNRLSSKLTSFWMVSRECQITEPRRPKSRREKEQRDINTLTSLPLVAFRSNDRNWRHLSLFLTETGKRKAFKELY